MMAVNDPKRTSLRPDIHKCLWLTMRVFLVGFEIRMLGFLERLFKVFMKQRVRGKQLMFMCNIQRMVKC